MMTTPNTWKPSTTVNPSGDVAIDSLLIGTKWVSGVLSYSFANNASVWSTDFYIGYWPSFYRHEPYTGFQALTALNQAYTKQAISSWANVSKVSFVQVADNNISAGDIRFAYSNLLSDAQAWAYSPANAAYAGDVWFNSEGTSNHYAWTLGSYEYLTVVHEIGHALGLDHPFDSPDKISAPLPQDQDYLWNTVMSYSAQPGNTNAFLDFNPTSPMSLDIQAMQYLYGANMTYHAGNDTYTFTQNSHYLQTIWDANGVDTIRYVATSLGCEIDLRPGEWSKLGSGIRIYNIDPMSGLTSFERIEYDTVNIYDTVIIENAIGGAFGDVIFGNSANNSMSGGAGNDTLYGGAGNDTLDGGIGVDDLAGESGDDVYIVDTLSDLIVELDSDGVDTIKATISYSLIDTDAVGDNGGNVEKLILLGTVGINGTGNALNNEILGNAGVNVLNGNEGQDLLNGVAGNDILEGGLDNDTLIGGAGADSMTGGAGNDTYEVDNIADKVIESPDDGIDTIKSTISYSLIDTDGIGINGGNNGGNVENLTLLGLSAINGTGNALNNEILGNAAANLLDGGFGADAMDGGNVNVTYIVDNGNDIVTEQLSLAQGGGTDLVRSSFCFVLGANLEHLTLTGLDNINGVGNDLNNLITGNSGDNNLDGGIGIDQLRGGAGNDAYTVDLIQIRTTLANYKVALQDSITEAVNSGNDTVVLRGSYTGHVNATTLTLASNLENLDATSTSTTKLNLAGNGLNNTLKGNEVDNLLSGAAGNDFLIGNGGLDTLDGGLGADTLFGGDGADVFTFSVIESVAFDHVTDFTHGEDKVSLIGTGFLSKLPKGLFFDMFVSVNGSEANAKDNNDFVIYDEQTGNLYFDSDAIGIKAKVLIAIVGAGTNLTFDDFKNATFNAGGIELFGNTSGNVLRGGVGDDTIHGGNFLGEAIFGGNGNDILIATQEMNQTSANNLFGDAGSDYLSGGDAYDVLEGGIGNDTLDGGAGINTAAYNFAKSGVTVDLRIVGAQNTGSEGYDTLININNISGSLFNDKLYGNDGNNYIDGVAGSNYIFGAGGNDTLIGGSGSDTILGGDGDDLLQGNYGNNGAIDILNGGAGIDSASYYDSILNQGVNVNLSIKTAQNTIGGGFDILIDIENLTGSVYSDTLTGSVVDNFITAYGGNDKLFGLAGNDTLNGGEGADTLTGGIGCDILSGELNADIFDVNDIGDSEVGVNRDVIADFSQLEFDKIDLSTIDANAILLNNQAFTFIGTDAFSAAGQLRFDAGILSGDVNGDNIADFEIELTGIASLISGDFIL